MTASPHLPNIAKLRFWGILSGGSDRVGPLDYAQRRGLTMLQNNARSAAPPANAFRSRRGRTEKAASPASSGVAITSWNATSPSRC